jgi:SagB-type dehydrogenase family enzyme
MNELAKEGDKVIKHNRRAFLRAAALAAAGATAVACAAAAPVVEQAMDLPAPNAAAAGSLEEALARRRSVRRFTNEALTEEEIGQLLWSMQGITRDWGARTAPSAGALYPLEVYVVTTQGLAHYVPQEHRVTLTPRLGLRQELWEPGLKQDCIREAPAVFVIAAVYERTAAKYGDRAERYVHLEAGHVAENLLLQAVTLGLGGVPIGAFYDDRVKAVLDLPEEQDPLYLIPIGHPDE